MSVKCPRCGYENKENASSCESCGFDFLENTTKYSPERTGTSGEVIMPVKPKKRALSVIFPEELEETFELEEGSYRIGRNPDSEIFLNDLTVSRNHAELKVEKDAAVIRDLGSLNGTFVNERLIEEPKELQDGDVIQIGRFKLLFTSGEVD